MSFQTWRLCHNSIFHHVMSVPEATKWVCGQTLPIAIQPLDLESNMVVFKMGSVAYKTSFFSRLFAFLFVVNK